MVQYQLDLENGRLHMEDPDIARTEPHDGEHEIWLMDLDEFKTLEGYYPYKRTLVRSMELIQYCKVETFHSCIQGTMRVPKRDVKMGVHYRFGFYIRDDLLILVEDRGSLKGLLEKLRTISYENGTPTKLLLSLLELLIEEDVLLLQQLEERLSDIEETVLKRPPDHFYETVMGYRKKLAELRAYYEQLMNIGDMLQINHDQSLSQEECAAWLHYTNRTERLHSYVETLQEYLLQIRELYQSQMEVNQNRVMTFLTVVTTIFLPLTLIAGWYGMNFPNMPEFRWQYGYPLVILISLAMVTAEVAYFRRKKML